MYAIVKVGGKQYRVEKGDSIVVDRLAAGEGDKVELEPLLLRPDGNDEPVFDGAELGKVKIDAVVKGHERGPKVRVLKFKPKKGYKRRTGHRSELTRLEISEIKVAARKSPAKKQAEPKEPAKKAGTTRERKPAAKRSATTKKESSDGS